MFDQHTMHICVLLNINVDQLRMQCTFIWKFLPLWSHWESSKWIRVSLATIVRSGFLPCSVSIWPQLTVVLGVILTLLRVSPTCCCANLIQVVMIATVTDMQFTERNWILCVDPMRIIARIDCDSHQICTHKFGHSGKNLPILYRQASTAFMKYCK